MMTWFGPLELVGTARCFTAEGHIETPVGAWCPGCQQEIKATDRGERLGGVETRGDQRVGVWVYFHAECVPS